MSSTKPVPAKDSTTGRFLPGNSGGSGRPLGARNKLGEAFVADLYASWQDGGRAAIEQVRQNDPAAYLRIVASLLPKEPSVAADPWASCLTTSLQHCKRCFRPWPQNPRSSSATKTPRRIERSKGATRGPAHDPRNHPRPHHGPADCGGTHPARLASARPCQRRGFAPQGRCLLGTTPGHTVRA
jgi:hypothetical protein